MTITPQPQENTPTRFIPLMVRFVTPINLVLVLIAVVGVFLLSNSLSGNVQAVEENLLIQSAVQIAQATQVEYNTLLQETQRIAFTQGIAEAVKANDANTLQTLLEPIAALTDLDSIIITDAIGQEIVGLLQNNQANDFSLSQGTNLANEWLVQNILNTASSGDVGILQTPNGSTVYVAIPIHQDGTPIGVLLAGRYSLTLLEAFQSNTLTEVTLYSADSTLLDTTLELNDSNQTLLDTHQSTLDQTLSNSNQVTVADGLSLNGQDYRVAYIPLSMGETTLGALSILMSDNVAMATSGGRQISAFLMAILAGAVTLVAIISVNLFTRRIEKVTHTVDALAQGENVRVDMKPTDEIGQMAEAVNRYADVVQEREDIFRVSLHRHRRERDYLLLAFEAIPEGVIVQDMEGRVVLMNDPARELLGSQRVFRSAGIHELTSVVNATLGNSIAPGLYTLGNPKRIELDETILLAQASAIVVGTGQRLGSIVLLRDITETVKREQARENIMEQIVEDVQVVLQDTSRQAMQNEDGLVRRLARDIAKHASTLQSMIIEMRELTQYSQQKTQSIQRSLSVETLVWGVANDWRQIAQASGITLSVILEARGLFVLGDEQRLRYALGNLVDNAIKYTQDGGKLSIEVRGETQNMLQLRIRDNGVGVSTEDMPQIFVRYYRGQPTTDTGQVIHVPGMGQGLTDTQQIITAHGGQIRIKSKVEIGTAAYIALPITASQSYQLPMIEDELMEGETMLIPDHVSVEDFWRGNDKL
jgi:two-component system, OmpR family, sensor histidine kinase ResE